MNKLTDDELAATIVSALVQAKVDDAVWRALTFGAGPYSITKPRDGRFGRVYQLQQRESPLAIDFGLMPLDRPIQSRPGNAIAPANFGFGHPAL